MNSNFEYDYVIIGSGFGGSVSAHRLTEKGYKVAVIEMGKRFEDKDFPKTTWNLRKYFWLPVMRCFGIFRMTLFKHVWVLSGTGVGGGSLVYGNTLLIPPEKIWDDPRWKELNDWKQIMPKHYNTARKMLGVVTNQHFGPADELLKRTAIKEGVGDTFYPTEVGVYFGEEGVTKADPYFNGKGPKRTGCVFCGGCMVGCPHGAKNTLVKNYLYLAEQAGAEVRAETLVYDVVQLGGSEGGYEVSTKSSTNLLFKEHKKIRTKGVIFAGGVLGTVKLLFELKLKGSLSKLSSTLGNFIRTNSESILGVRMNKKSEFKNLSDGIAIGSGIYIDEDTHIEAVRYSKGSDSLATLTTPLTAGAPGMLRIILWLKTMALSPLKTIRGLIPFGFANSSIILLVMQTMDTHLKMKFVRSWLPPFKKKLQTEGDKIPTYIPAANRFAESMGIIFNGEPLTSITEILLDVPTTAHILGGATMGKDESSGVINYKNEVFNYPNMYVCDGSMVSANLGVNPSLSITALTEQAMSHIPNKAN